MTLTMMLLLAAAIVLPLVWIARRHSTGKTVKKPLIVHRFSALCAGGRCNCVRLCLLRLRHGLRIPPRQQLLPAVWPRASKSVGRCPGRWSQRHRRVGIAVSSAAAAALGAMSENDSIFGKALIFVGLAQGVALYGLLVALLMLFM